MFNRSDKAKWFALLAIFMILPPRANAQEPRPEIRGKPIVATTTNELGETRKRRYPKPDPLQIRMIKNRLGGREQMSDAGTPPLSPTNIVQLVEDSSGEGRLDADGYRQTSFSALAGFPFDLTEVVASGAGDPAAAKAATLAQIPGEIQKLDGTRVFIRGFLVPLKMDDGKTVEFLLMRDQTLCCFGAIPRPHQWITVKVAKGPKPVMDLPVTVYGKLSVGDHREGGFLTGIYAMEADRVVEP